MKRKPSPIKDLLFLTISSFIVVVAWIGFNLYHTWVTSTITPELQTSIKPITAEFDILTINKLKSRQQVTPINSLSNKIVIPTPTLTVPLNPSIPATNAATPASFSSGQSQGQSQSLDFPSIPGE